MTDCFSMFPIGQCDIIDGQFTIVIRPERLAGLTGLADFSHLIVLWWAHEADRVDLRQRLTISSPYTSCDGSFGVFSTRSEARPNPIGMSVISLTSVDPEAGTVRTPYFDMLPKTPILDLKPYFPASDRVTSARIPSHFAHWPPSWEDSAAFDWSAEFTA